MAFYMQNSPEFIFAWLALWEIGAAPAMINYNLGGEALIHCLTIGKAKEGPYIVLVDEDQALRARIEEVRETLEGGIGAEIVIMDDGTRDEISSFEAKRVPDEVRKDVQGNWPLALFYTSGTTGMPKGMHLSLMCRVNHQKLAPPMLFTTPRFLLMNIYANTETGCPINVAAGYASGLSRKLGTSVVGPDDRWYNWYVCSHLMHMIRNNCYFMIIRVHLKKMTALCFH